MSAANGAEPDAAQPTVEQDALSPSPPHGDATVASERPELTVAAAFAGGFALALVLKRLGR